MESHENPPKPNNKIHPFPPKLKPFLLTSVVVAVIAISFTFTKANFYRTLQLKSVFSSHKSQKFAPNPPSTSPYCLLWMAPFLSGGGYSSEAWSYILSLHQHMKNPRFKLSIEQHGDQENIEFWDGLPQPVRSLAFELYNTECRVNETIVICHSEPGAWYPPLFQTLPCPPPVYGKFKYTIGRTMFETDRLKPDHVKRCNQMDFVWVPSQFHVSTFVESGVEPSKVVKIVQAVDVNFFNPHKYEPFDLGSIGNLVLGTTATHSSKQYVFLSVFKWEYRKGWDVLLRAYLKQFSKADGVSLYLLTNPYHTDGNFGNKIVEFVDDSDMEKPRNGWAPIYVIDRHIAEVDMPRIYAAADAFVLPTRGEGWGRPIVEAMAMALPVIGTNWSGPTEYLRDENSYPLGVERMSEVMEGAFRGHLWAEPSADKLGMLMRHVVRNREEAKAKGRKAREDMINNFSPHIVSEILTQHIQFLLAKNR